MPALRRRLARLEIERPSFQLTRLIELDLPFRTYVFRRGKVAPADPPILREMAGKDAARPICAHLFRQGRAHWRKVGLGESTRVLGLLDAALRRGESAELLLRRARLRQCVGRIELAIEDYEALLRDDPDNSRAMAWLGEAWIQLGDLPKGIRMLDLARRSLPADVWILAWRSEAKRLLGRLGEAATDLKAAISLQPKLGALHVLRGKEGRLADLDYALRLDPGNTWGRILRGHHRHRTRDFRGAERDFSRILQEDPHCLWAFVMRARSRIALGKRRPAENDYLAAMSVEPGCIGARSKDVLRHGYLPFHPFGAPLHWVSKRVKKLQKEARAGQAWAHGALAEYREFYEFALPEIQEGLRLSPRDPVLNAFQARSITLKGQAWLKRGLEAMNKTAALAPSWGWVYAWRAEIHKRLGRHGAALRDQNRCARLGPTYPILYAWRGGLKRLAGRPAAAIRDFDRAMDIIRELGDDYDFLHQERCMTLVALGRELEAVDEFCERACASAGVQWGEPAKAPEELSGLDSLIRRHPKYARSFAVRADILLRLVRAQEALASCERALLEASPPALAFCLRAEALGRLGRAPEGLADIGKAIALRPFSPRFYAVRANLFLGLGRLKDSIADMDRFLSFLYREDGYQTLRARLRRKTGSLRRAHRELDEVLGVQLRSPWAHYERFFCRLGSGDIDGALRDLSRAKIPEQLTCGGKHVYVSLPVDPIVNEDFSELAARKGEPFAWAWKGVLFFHRGLTDRALDCWGRKGAAARCGWARAWRAAVHLDKGETDRALDDLNASLKAFPRFGWALSLRAKTFLRQGAYAQAARDIDKALSFEPDIPEALADRAWLRLRQGRLRQALEDMDRSIRLDCRHAWAFGRRGEIRLRLGDLEGAVSDLDEALLMHGEYGEAFSLRAEANLLSGCLKEAYSDSEKALALLPGQSRPLTVRALARRGLGDLKGSVKDLRAAARAQGSSIAEVAARVNV